MDKYKIITLGVAAGFILTSDLQATKLSVPTALQAGTVIGTYEVNAWPTLETAKKVQRAARGSSYAAEANALVSFLEGTPNLHGVPQTANEDETWLIMDAMKSAKHGKTYGDLLHHAWHDAGTTYTVYEGAEMVRRIQDMEEEAAGVESAADDQAVQGLDHQTSVALKHKAERANIARGWALTILLNENIDVTGIDVAPYSLGADTIQQKVARAKAVAKLNALFGEGNKWAHKISKDAAAAVIAKLISRTLGGTNAGNLAACVHAGDQLDGQNFGQNGGGKGAVPNPPADDSGFYTGTDLAKDATDTMIRDLVGTYQAANFGGANAGEAPKFLLLCQALPKAIRDALRARGVLAE